MNAADHDRYKILKEMAVEMTNSMKIKYLVKICRRGFKSIGRYHYWNGCVKDIIEWIYTTKS